MLRIETAQPLHPDIFSRDVASSLGMSYQGGKINARFSRVGKPGEAMRTFKRADGAGRAVCPQTAARRGQRALP